jgi:hypothetical protein
MHAADVLRYGHLTLLSTLERVPESRWEVGGACGYWSVKNLVAHLASYEQVLVDLLTCLRDGRPESFSNPIDVAFNDAQVAQRQHLSPGETLDEYQGAHARVMALIEKLPADTVRQSGLLPWYGAEYDLEDYLVYTFYGHKREHSGQIAIFADSSG